MTAMMGPRGLLAALALGATLAAAAAPAAAETVVVRPTVGGVPVDHCFTWASNCDRVAANKVCQQMGHSHAVAWDWTYMNRTYVLGEGRHCQVGPQVPECGGFTRVICETGRSGGRPCRTNNDCPGSICLLGVCAD